MNENIQTIFISSFSIFSLIAGLIGLVFVFPLLDSDCMEDLARAGFIFLASSMLFSAGLVSLALIKKRKRH
ncbi:MAG: hypothetical protein WCX31_12585 [Salinivirgaceae bacterium]